MMRDAMLVWLALVVSGCAEASGGEPDEPEFEDLDLEATKSTGIIRGVVVNIAISPVAGAKVVLTPTGLETTSNAEGLFGFDGLEPGHYFLRVTKTAHTPTQQATEVIAGAASPPIVRVLLEKVPGLEPYFLEQHYSAYISCGFKAANYVFDASDCDPADVLSMQSNDDSAPVFEVERRPDHFQSEMMWEASQLLAEGLVTIQETCDLPDCSGRNRICNVRGVSPLVCRVNGTAGGGGGGVGLIEAGMGDGRGVRVGMYANCFNQCVLGAVGVGVVLEQPIEIFNFLFYNYVPPTDWVFVNDGYVPEPPR